MAAFSFRYDSRNRLVLSFGRLSQSSLGLAWLAQWKISIRLKSVCKTKSSFYFSHSGQEKLLSLIALVYALKQSRRHTSPSIPPEVKGSSANGVRPIF
ncbi:hypothetical protein Q3G72_018105 [Acer saccharum]|nr:hypothetical protein Q3G72_018105 [Acer saccharum]